MANSLHVAKLEEGARAWNAWRAENPGLVPDLSDLDLSVGRRQFGPVQGGPIDLSRADLSGSALEQATLIEANLVDAVLVEADLSQARMENADLRGANLSNANLDQTDLKDVLLRHATLSGAQLQRARNLTQAQIDQAIGDENTKLPPELIVPQAWLKEPKATFSRLAKRAGNKASIPKGDPHGVLGVRRRASTREVRAAYLRLARELHPDGRVDDPVAAERLKLINDAYQELKGFGGRAQARRAERQDFARRARKGFLVGFLTSAPVLLAVFAGFYYAGYFGPTDVASKSAATDQEKSKQAAGPDRLKAGPAAERKNAIDKREIAWVEAERIGTKEALQRFLEEHRDSDHAAKAKRAIAAIDAAEAKQRAAITAWASIEKNATRDDLQRFLEEHRDSDHAAKAKQTIAAIDAAEARQRAATTAWVSIEKNATRDDLQGFLEEHRDSDHAAKAKRAIAAIDAAEAKQRAATTAWASIEKNATRDDLQRFIEEHRDSDHAAKAKRTIAAIDAAEAKQRAAATAWASIEKNATRDDLQRFLEEHRDSDHAAKAKRTIAAIDAAEAKQRAAATAWASIEKNATRDDLQRFLEEHRDSDHAAKAKRTIAAIDAAEAKQALAAIDAAEAKQRAENERVQDESAWLKAERRNSKAAYRIYLSAYPNGRRAGDAHGRIAELERVEAKALADAVLKEPKQAPTALRPNAPEPAMSQRWPSADEPFIGADGRIRR